jgi:hypothetical protein
LKKQPYKTRPKEVDANLLKGSYRGWRRSAIHGDVQAERLLTKVTTDDCVVGAGKEGSIATLVAETSDK